jgi:hypothetical protein
MKVENGCKCNRPFSGSLYNKDRFQSHQQSKMISMPNELESLESLMKLTMQSTIVEMIPVMSIEGFLSRKKYKRQNQRLPSQLEHVPDTLYRMSR